MAKFPVDQLHTAAEALDLGDASAYHLPNWNRLSHPEKLGVIRQIATSRGRDPRIAKLAGLVVRNSGARPRQYKRQASALLRWVQNPRNIYYLNEAGETLQDPVYTVQRGIGDCDCTILLLCALFEAIRLPWRLVISGRDTEGNPHRYIEGTAHLPPSVKWDHIYCMVGAPPDRPQVWWFCEPTIERVPLGWDVISGSRRYLPSYPDRYEPGSPVGGNLGGSMGPMVGALIAVEGDEGGAWTKQAKSIALGVVTGVSISVITSILTPWLKNKLGLGGSNG